MTREIPDNTRIPIPIVVAAAVAGAVLGVFEIANTSIGWHLASGDWILSNKAFIHTDPFSFTSGGARWIDHEWLFQVGVSIVHSLAGPAGLVALRALIVAALAVLLLVVGSRCRLSPAAAIVLSITCVAGARGRYFMRPELVTLLIVPAVVWLFLSREKRESPLWLAALAGLMVVGANAHGGALVVPPLLAGLLAAEIAQMALARRWQKQTLVSGFAGLGVATAALLVNPYGWHLLTVPLHLSRLVNLDHIPNPEWISPTPAQAPLLYVALGAAVIVLAIRERNLVRWALLVMAALLALRHIRNVGLFFVLLPLAVSPALVTWRGLSAAVADDANIRRRTNLLAVAAAMMLALSLAIAPHPRFGFAFAADYFPDAACSFLDREGLPQDQLYNDVRFGGYLIHRYGPNRQVFQDDRNEIHEPLLRRIWEVFQASDVNGWSKLLAEHGAGTALVRYHPPIRVTDPAGNSLGLHGFSTLWFPQKSWALVYWDDVAMVLVRRQHAEPDWLQTHEYRAIRPDDLSQLAARIESDADFRIAVANELDRALKNGQDGRRARTILGLLR
jgi:hypothetical protein